MYGILGNMSIGGQEMWVPVTTDDLGFSDTITTL